MGAASNRIKNLAEGLTLSNKKVTVICPIPSYPKGQVFNQYKGKYKVTEKLNGVLIKRYWSYPSKSKNNFVRFFSMTSFAFSLWAYVFCFSKKTHSLCIVNSPPLFVAMSGLLLSKFMGCKNVLNISDLWPLSALELGVLRKGSVYRLLKNIELFNYRLSEKIIGQSDEIGAHVTTLGVKKFFTYRNLPIFKKYPPKSKQSGKLSLVYAGLLGYAQGIIKICRNINFKELGVEFHIYGDGMEKNQIIHYSNPEVNNIFFHGTFNSSEVKEEIRKYDVGIVPLKNRIQGAVPSKLFELMQLGVPILYTCRGEASRLIQENNLGFVSESNSYESIQNTILKFKNLPDQEFLKMSENCLKKHKMEFRFDNQLRSFLSFIN